MTGITSTGTPEGLVVVEKTFGAFRTAGIRKASKHGEPLIEIPVVSLPFLIGPGEAGL